MVKNFEDMFIRFHATHERDRQTDGQTPNADIGRAYASHRAATTEWAKLDHAVIAACTSVTSSIQ